MRPLLYVDTSALLDRAFGQQRHRAIAEVLRSHAGGGGRLVSSRLMHLEARRAFVRERLRGHDARSILALADQITALPVTDEVWAAAHAIEQHAKTFDALHLATCALVGAILLSTDAGMLGVADAMGITVHPATRA